MLTYLSMRNGGSINRNKKEKQSLIERIMEGFPRWLSSLLQTKFYEPCETHSSKQCNFFCLDCIGSKSTFTLCENCNKANKHEDHNIIQVYKASRHTGLVPKKLKHLLDVSDIQTYKINLNTIIYINPRPYNEQQVNDKHNSYHRRCETCNKELIQHHHDYHSSTYKFCSIGCKVVQDRHARIQRRNTIRPLSFRKRPRKSSPHRSSLF
ncbi:uncharacterized protein LOC125370725 [Ricinus communis]|uniref:uncharacterized protein LOC125370725 n=1 Tax=Ricinus communis TaxID=3988 RepID=UPI00201AACD4|nr:uncharacterized protein LOC125370725 [Ricinus communis]